MAEQLIGSGYINEVELMRINVRKARQDIATSLICSSGKIN